MTSVNELNAQTREQARIREAVVTLPTYGSESPLIKREDVLAIIRNDK